MRVKGYEDMKGPGEVHNWVNHSMGASEWVKRKFSLFFACLSTENTLVLSLVLYAA